MVVISNKGLVVEKMIIDERSIPEKFTFIYSLIAIIYNLFLKFFYSYTYWIIAHVLTIAFLFYKLGILESKPKIRQKQGENLVKKTNAQQAQLGFMARR